jgi:GNAT superfamily N-acetyltransferase
MEYQLYDENHLASAELLQRCFFKKDAPDIDWSRTFLAIAEEAGEIVGSGYLCYYPWTRTAMVPFLEVAAHCRRQGIGSALFQLLAKRAKEKGIDQVVIDFDEVEGSAPSIWPFLQKFGAKERYPLLFRCHFDGRSFSAPWLDYPITLPKNLLLFPWHNLKDEEKKQLMERIAKGQVPSVLSPFFQEEKIAHFNSFGLRSKEEGVVGWVITRYLSPIKDAITYGAFYIDPPYRSHGLPLYMLCCSIKKQIHSKVHLSQCEASYADVDSRWIAFLQRRLVPYCEFTSKRYRVVLGTPKGKTTEDTEITEFIK